MTYDNFREAIVRAGWETAVSTECKYKGWYKASKAVLAPAVDKKIDCATICRTRAISTLNPMDINQLQQQLKEVNKQNHDLIDLAKARWYGRICTNTHNMRMNPRLARGNIHLLTGKETAHHKTNINMAMKLKSGDLASNAKESMSIFSMYFHKVLSNHIHVDDLELDLIRQKPRRAAIDTPITFR